MISKKNKAIDTEFNSQLASATELISLRFEQESQSRAQFEKKFKSLVIETFDSLKRDLEKEISAAPLFSRPAPVFGGQKQGISGLEAKFEGDFEKIENEMREIADAAYQTDAELNKIFDDLLERVTEECDAIKKEKDTTEERILAKLKEVNKVKDEIEEEKKNRERVEETLLGLLETTRSKLIIEGDNS